MGKKAAVSFVVVFAMALTGMLAAGASAQPLRDAPAQGDIQALEHYDAMNPGEREMVDELPPREDTIGGQTDSHGCLIAAGYTWCESRGECLRAWEEECPGLEVAPVNRIPEDPDPDMVYALGAGAGEGAGNEPNAFQALFQFISGIFGLLFPF